MQPLLSNSAVGHCAFACLAFEHVHTRTPQWWRVRAHAHTHTNAYRWHSGGQVETVSSARPTANLHSTQIQQGFNAEVLKLLVDKASASDSITPCWQCLAMMTHEHDYVMVEKEIWEGAVGLETVDDVKGGREDGPVGDVHVCGTMILKETEVSKVFHLLLTLRGKIQQSSGLNATQGPSWVERDGVAASNKTAGCISHWYCSSTLAQEAADG